MFTLVDIIAKGGLVMIPLLFCSVIALPVVIERARFWKKTGAYEWFQNVFNAVETHDFAKSRELAAATDSPVGRVLVAGLAHVNPSSAKAMEVAAQAQIPVFRKRLTILDTIITLAPLSGLLGTVVGMIGSYDIMSLGVIGQTHAITGDVAEALTATATRLTIEILTLVPYKYFSTRAERGMERIEYNAWRSNY